MGYHLAAPAPSFVTSEKRHDRRERSRSHKSSKSKSRRSKSNKRRKKRSKSRSKRWQKQSESEQIVAPKQRKPSDSMSLPRLPTEVVSDDEVIVGDDEFTHCTIPTEAGPSKAARPKLE